MPSSSTAMRSDDSGLVPSDQPVLFLDWPLSDSSQPQGSLLDGTDFSTCKTVFFDPWEFAPDVIVANLEELCQKVPIRR